MISRILAASVAIAFLVSAAATPTITIAATANKEETKKAAAKKELTPQQQKMKGCASKWGDEKKSKNVKGRKAYNEFMSGCLKG